MLLLTRWTFAMHQSKVLFLVYIPRILSPQTQFLKMTNEETWLMIFFFSGSVKVIAANNDAQVRVFDAQNFTHLNCFKFPWSVNVSIFYSLLYL